MGTTNIDLLECVRRGDSVGAVFHLNRGADPNYHDLEYGWTPLHHAARNGHFQLLKLLLAKGANPDTLDSLGQTPLHRFIYHF